ncbi:MAG: PD-(D/E)XK nuclease family protein [bacterium]|nr:PD-(D/E)XK nuclease family protein [bacterium]
MTTRAFSRHDAVLNEVTSSASFQDMLSNVASLDCTLIVPSTAHKRAALVTLTRQTTGRKPPEIYTLATYAQYIVRERSTENLRLLNTADASLILRYAARSAGLRLGSIDFSIHRLLRWKSEGITRDELLEKSADEFAPRHVRVLDGFVRIWSAYELSKGPKGADRVDVLVKAARLVLEAPKVADRRFVVWCPHTFTRAEAALVRAIGVHGSVAIVWAPSSDAQLVNERTSDMIGWGWENVGGEDTGHSSDDAVTRHKSIRVFRESTRVEEVRRILLAIKQAVSSGGINVRDICIITPGSSEYRRQLQERATRAGIPLAVDPQRTLHTSGVALALRAACDVVGGAWKRADLERLLRSGFVMADSTNAGALLHAATAHRVQGGQGFDGWKQKLSSRREVLRIVHERDEEIDRGIRRTLAVLDEALRTLAWLRLILGDDDRSIKGAAYTQMLTAFLERLGIARTAVHLEKIALSENLPCVEREALVAIEALSERYAVLTSDVDMPLMTIAEHTREWWELVRATKVRTPDVLLDGIPILTPEEARGRMWKLVLAPGFVEGEFPLHEHDPLEAEVLPESALRKQRAAFEDIIHATSIDGHLVVTYPKEVDDSDVLPSSFLRGLDIEPHDEATFFLDAYERTAHTGTGLRDVKGRQRAALPEANEAVVQSTAEADESAVLSSGSAALVQYVADIVNRPLSASRLDVVAACPYKFYASTILRLDVEHTTDDTLSGLERGSMMHEIVRQFYERVRGRSYRTITTTEELLDARVELEDIRRHEYMGILLDVYMSVAPLYDTDHTYAETERRSLLGGPDGPSMLGTPQRPGLLYRWLAHEIAQQSKSAMRPALFEYELDVVVGGEAIRGRVDRIDVAPYQFDDGHNGVQFAVVDYKTTKASAPSAKSVMLGEATQMPLYLTAVHAEFLKHGIEAIPAQAIYRTFGRSLKTVEDPKDLAVLANPSEELMQNLFNTINEHVKDMRASSYPVAPRPKACDRCGFQEVCRVASWGTVQRT